MDESPESPCIPCGKRQDHPAREAGRPVLLNVRRRPEERRAMRQWLVKVLARRAIEILQGREDGR
jgi:hypothetical protein